MVRLSRKTPVKKQNTVSPQKTPEKQTITTRFLRSSKKELKDTPTETPSKTPSETPVKWNLRSRTKSTSAELPENTPQKQEVCVILERTPTPKLKAELLQNVNNSGEIENTGHIGNVLRRRASLSLKKIADYVETDDDETTPNNSKLFVNPSVEASESSDLPGITSVAHVVDQDDEATLALREKTTSKNDERATVGSPGGSAVESLVEIPVLEVSERRGTLDIEDEPADQVAQIEDDVTPIERHKSDDDGEGNDLDREKAVEVESSEQNRTLPKSQQIEPKPTENAEGSSDDEITVEETESVSKNNKENENRKNRSSDEKPTLPSKQHTEPQVNESTEESSDEEISVEETASVSKNNRENENRKSRSSDQKPTSPLKQHTEPQVSSDDEISVEETESVSKNNQDNEDLNVQADSVENNRPGSLEERIDVRNTDEEASSENESSEQEVDIADAEISMALIKDVQVAIGKQYVENTFRGVAENLVNRVHEKFFHVPSNDEGTDEELFSTQETTNTNEQENIGDVIGDNKNNDLQIVQHESDDNIESQRQNCEIFKIGTQEESEIGHDVGETDQHEEAESDSNAASVKLVTTEVHQVGEEDTNDSDYIQPAQKSRTQETIIQEDEAEDSTGNNSQQILFQDSDETDEESVDQKSSLFLNKISSENNDSTKPSGSDVDNGNKENKKSLSEKLKGQSHSTERSDNFFNMLSNVETFSENSEEEPFEDNESETSGLQSLSTYAPSSIKRNLFQHDSSDEGFYGKNQTKSKKPVKKTKQESKKSKNEEKSGKGSKRKTSDISDKEDNMLKKKMRFARSPVDESESEDEILNVIEKLSPKKKIKKLNDNPRKSVLESKKQKRKNSECSDDLKQKKRRKDPEVTDEDNFRLQNGDESFTTNILSEDEESLNDSPSPKPAKEPQKYNYNIPTDWPINDVEELLQRVESTLPESDKMQFIERFKQVTWENIAFKTYTPQECKKVFKMVNGRVRQHRILKEIIEDSKVFLQRAKTKHKKNADSDAPKRPPSMFILYWKENFKKLSEKYRGERPAKISKILSRDFKNLSNDEKNELWQRRQVEVKAYYKKLKEYYSQNPKEIPFKRSNKVAKKIVKRNPPPEPPPKPFALFYNEELEKNGNIVSDEFMDSCREHWRELEDDEKLKYLAEADRLLKKYEKDLKEYCFKYPLYEPEPIKVFSKKEEKLLATLDKPKKPPPTSFLVFYQIMSKEDAIKKLKGEERLRVLQDQWGTYNDEQREVYRIRRDQLWRKYAAELEEYIKKFPAYKRDYIRKKELKGNRHVLDEVLKKSKNNNARKHKLKEKIEKEPKMPPSTAYSYFVSKCEDDDPKTAWANLSKREKDSYKEQLDKLKKKYIREFEHFLKGMTEEELEVYARTQK